MKLSEDHPTSAHMSRLANCAAWLVGAIVPTVGYWYVVVYLLDDFNHGYGRDTWFQLQLYLFALSVLAGLVGYALAALPRTRPSAFSTALLAGVVFSVGELLLVFVLRRAFPDRDMVAHQITGALVIGAASVLVASARGA